MLIAAGVGLKPDFVWLSTCRVEYLMQCRVPRALCPYESDRTWRVRRVYGGRFILEVRLYTVCITQQRACRSSSNSSSSGAFIMEKKTTPHRASPVVSPVVRPSRTTQHARPAALRSTIDGSPPVGADVARLAPRRPVARSSRPL